MKRFRDTEYFITEDGDIFRNGVKKKSAKSKNAYFCAQLWKNGKYKMYYIHRLVAELYLENPSNLPQVNHKDGNKSNNNVENLEWVSAKDNSLHAHSMGLINNKGVKNPNSKLTQEDIIYIRSVYKPYDKDFGCKSLAKKYNVNKSHIIRIIKKEKWSWLV